MLKKIFSILIVMLLVVSAFSQTPQLMWPRVELQFPYKLKTYTGITTKLDISASVNDTGVYIQSFKWDLYSDNKTVKTVTGNTIQCVYPVAGKTRTTVTALLSDGGSAQISFNVEVVAGKGTQSLQFESIPSLVPIGSRLKSAQYNPRDGVVNKYAILMNGAFGDDASKDSERLTIRLYNSLVDDYGYSHANIQYLDPKGSTLSNVDAASSLTALRDAFVKINETIDSDDLLFVSFMTHGSGYYGLDNFSGCESNDGGRLGPNVRLIENGSEVSESNFKLRVLDVPRPVGKQQFNGLNKWQVIIGNKTDNGIKTAWCYRVRFRADADADALLELEVDYLKGYSTKEIPYPVYSEASFGNFDFNKNGKGSFEYISDGVYSFPDSTEWNNTPTILIDNCILRSGHVLNFKQGSSTVSRNYVLFDKKINGNKGDGKIDFVFYDDPNTDIATLPIDAMRVNGSDTDGDGIIDCTDLNGDGDKTDGWDIDELVITGVGIAYSTDLANMLNSMGNEKSIVWVLSCFSGGFIKHISAPGRTICTATQDRYLGNSDVFLDYVKGMDRSSDGYTPADENRDGSLTMLELYRYVSRENYDNKIDGPRYNDNGDGIMYLGQISAKPEAGCFGSSMTLSGYTGYSQVMSSIANQTVSTAVSYSATDMNVQNLTVKPTGTVNIHTLPSLNGKISLGVMTIEPGGRLVIDKQYCK